MRLSTTFFSEREKEKKIEIKYQSVFHSAVWPQSLSFRSQISRFIFGCIPVYDFVQKPAVGLILSFRSRNYWHLSSKLREILALILLLFLKAVIWLFMFSYYVSSRVEKHLFLARTTMKDLKRSLQKETTGCLLRILIYHHCYYNCVLKIRRFLQG